MFHRNVFFSLLVLLPAFIQAEKSETEKLNDDYNYDITVTPAIGYSITIGLGVLVAFFGYKLFKVTTFLCAFVVGGTFCYDVFFEAFRSKSYVDNVSLVGGIIGGLALGLLVLKFYKLGIFLVGAAGGVLLGQFLTTSFLYKISPEHPEAVQYTTIILLGILCGVLAIKIERSVIITITAWVGSVAILRGIGFFAGGYPIPEDLTKASSKYRTDGEVDVPKVWWYYFVATILMFFFASIVQFKYTAANVDHCENNKKEKKANNEAPRATQDGLPTRLV